ncbi:hypothetical protein FLA_0449 [Filimonas lacunae]|nr:hypothetical protein FLA_0449 [Filimonas lacunae]
MGAVADTPQQPMEHKTFASRFLIDFDKIQAEEAAYEEIPVIRNVTQAEVMENYYQIKQDIKNLIAYELAKLKKQSPNNNNNKNNGNNPAVST